MKAYFGSPQFLSKPKESETLYMYLAVSERAVSAVLIHEEDKIKWPIYYVRRLYLKLKPIILKSRS